MLKIVAMKITITLFAFLLLFNIPTFSQIAGCNDNPASNYQSGATVNNGSCTYPFTMLLPTYKYNPGTVLSQIGGTIVWNDTLWALNDHNGAYIYALDTTTGASPVVKRTIQIAGASIIDWEEIAQDDNYIYIGDIGNNVDGNRTDLKIYKISKSDIQHSDIVTPQIINFSYADQTIVSGNTVNNTDFDCETFFVINGKIYLFTKQWKSFGTSVYEIPSINPGTYSATKIATYPTSGVLSGGDIMPDKRTIALVGYTTIYERFVYLLYDFNGVNFFGGNVRKISLYNTFKTEAVSFKDANTLYFGSEFIKMPTPYPDILQRIEVLDITPLMQSYYQKLSLPINYIQFKSTATNNSVKLHWEVFPADEFITGDVERKFSSAEAYKSIAPMSSYAASFTDNNVLLDNPLTFYRLKVTDKDNKINYSREISVNKKDAKKINFNVQSSSLFVETDNKLGGSLRIIQMDGKIKFESPITQQTTTVNINNWTTGVYIAIVVQNGISTTYKFQKGF